MTMATPATADHSAMACGRSAGGNTELRIDRVAGITKAAPTPITARHPIRAPAEPASAAPAEPTAYSTSPPTRAWRRPNRSPMVPAVTRRAAKTRLKASAIHCKLRRAGVQLAGQGGEGGVQYGVVDDDDQQRQAQQRRGSCAGPGGRLRPSSPSGRGWERWSWSSPNGR